MQKTPDTALRPFPVATRLSGIREVGISGGIALNHAATFLASRQANNNAPIPNASIPNEPGSDTSPTLPAPKSFNDRERG